MYSLAHKQDINSTNNKTDFDRILHNNRSNSSCQIRLGKDLINKKCCSQRSKSSLIKRNYLIKIKKDFFNLLNYFEL